MKKTLAILLVLAMSLALLTACGSSIKDQPDLTLPPPYISWMEKHVPGFVSDS